jgi:4-amino-4-deoxy-L-arabinose transferase-like glycosyltransferase
MNFSGGLSFFKKFRKELIVLVISLWALYLRIHQLAHSEIDGDALWQVGFIQGMSSFFELLKNLPKADHAGYLAGDFILIYPFFKIFGWNKWALAFPHLVITFVGFYFLYLLAREHFKTTWAYVISFLIFSLNSNLISHSVEIRAYAVMPTLALMALYFALKVFKKNVNMSLREKLWAGLAFVCIIWFHLYGILMVFCAGVYALLAHCRDERRRTVLWYAVKFFLCVLLIAMPLWCYSIFFAQTVNVKAMSIGREIQTFEYIPNPLMDSVGFARAIFGNLMGFKAVYLLGLKIKIKWLVNGILLALLIPQKDRSKQLGFFLVMIVLPLQLLFLADLFNRYWFIQRQFVWVMAWYAFFLGWCWDSIITATVEWVKIKRQTLKKQPVTA